MADCAESQIKSKKTTALAFSGAGANIIVEAGFAKAFRDSGLDYSYVDGTSSGAIAGAFFHSGQIDVLESICLRAKDKDIFSFAPWKLFGPSISLLDNAPLKRLLKTNLNCEALRRAGKSCVVNVSDLGSWTVKQIELTLLDDDDMVEAIVLSTAVPIAFPQTNGLVDGGVLRDYPLLNGLVEKADRVILFIPNTINPMVPKTLKQMIGSYVAASINNQLLSMKLLLTDLPMEVTIIEPEKPTGIGLLDFNGLGSEKARQAVIDMSYQLAKTALSKLT